MSDKLEIIGRDTFISSESLGQIIEPFPVEFQEKLQQIVKKYPSKKSAIMPALYLAQEHIGWISKEAIDWVSHSLDLPPAHVESVATFYTMYYKRPVGKYHIQLCRTLSCMLVGAKTLASYIEERLGVSAQEVSKDKMWSWEEVECLGSCGTAPMIQVNAVYFENLTIDSLRELMDRIEKEQPDLRYSSYKEFLGEGLNDYPRSKVI